MDNKILIDTDILIDFLRGDKNTVELIKGISAKRLITTDINAFELYHGAYKSKNKRENLPEVENLLDSMELIQELEVWYVIPAIRKELALAMHNSGLKQVEIAKRLGLTKAAINQYLSEKRGTEIKFNSKIKASITNSASRIKNGFDSVREIQYLLNISREEKGISLSITALSTPRIA